MEAGETEGTVGLPRGSRQSAEIRHGAARDTIIIGPVNKGCSLKYACPGIRTTFQSVAQIQIQESQKGIKFLFVYAEQHKTYMCV